MAISSLTAKTEVEATPKRVKPAEAAKVTVLLTPAQHKALKMYCVEEGTSLQDLFVSSVARTVAKKGVKL